MYPASARSPHTRSSARLAPMFPGFGMHRRSHLGSDYVRSGRSAVGRSSIQRVVASETASLWHCAWEPILCTTPTTISVSSSVITLKLGKAQAITATAHKLARIVFHLLNTKEAYNESVFRRCEEEALKHAELRLRKHAARMGFQLVSAANG